jgi:hypothetical protein
MAAYGERDLRRFPHVHGLYEQAYPIGAKLHRNAEEKGTKQREFLSGEAWFQIPVLTRYRDAAGNAR